MFFCYELNLIYEIQEALSTPFNLKFWWWLHRVVDLNRRRLNLGSWWRLSLSRWRLNVGSRQVDFNIEWLNFRCRKLNLQINLGLKRLSLYYPRINWYRQRLNLSWQQPHDDATVNLVVRGWLKLSRRRINVGSRRFNLCHQWVNLVG